MVPWRSVSIPQAALIIHDLYPGYVTAARSVFQCSGQLLGISVTQLLFTPHSQVNQHTDGSTSDTGFEHFLAGFNFLGSPTLPPGSS